MEIQEAVRKAIQATGYTPNQAARSLVTRRAGTIVLVMAGAPGQGEEFAAQVSRICSPGSARSVIFDPSLIVRESA